jgi:hypothetical protein
VENQAKRLQAIERSPAKQDAPEPRPSAAQNTEPQTPKPQGPAPQPLAHRKPASHNARAPALPAPIDIRPLPEPSRSARPGASVGR